MLHKSDCKLLITGECCSDPAPALRGEWHIITPVLREVIVKALESVKCWCEKPRAEHTHADSHRFESPGRLTEADTVLAALRAQPQEPFFKVFTRSSDGKATLVAGPDVELISEMNAAHAAQMADLLNGILAKRVPAPGAAPAASLEAKLERLRHAREMWRETENEIHEACDRVHIDKFCSHTGHEWSAGLRVKLVVEALERLRQVAGGGPGAAPSPEVSDET